MDGGEYVCGLNKNDLIYCDKVLNEKEVKRVDCINEIREWLKDNQHLNTPEDTFNILRFLRSGKFNIAKTKKKIKNFYTFKQTAPEWFKNRDPLLPELQELLKIGVFLPILKRDQHGRLVIIIRAAAHDPSLQSQNDVFKIGMMTLDLALMAEDTSVYGVAAIFDMKGVTLKHAKALGVRLIKKAVTSWQMYPVRLRTLEFINSPVYIDVVLNVFRFFMTQKMKNRKNTKFLNRPYPHTKGLQRLCAEIKRLHGQKISSLVHVHGCNVESLHLSVSKEILPEEYGGTNGKLQDLIDYWHHKVTDSRQWLMDTERHIANVVK